MKKLILFIFVLNLFGITKEEIYSLYKNHDYINTCNKGMWIIRKNNNDDNYQSIVSLSCVKVDMINTAIRIAKTMNHTPIGRHNASYISSLFLIKKLLLQLVYDKIDISNLSLPKSEHPLSIMFENISHNNFSKVNNTYIVESNNKKYILSPIEKDKFIIKILENNNLISKHIYW